MSPEADSTATAGAGTAAGEETRPGGDAGLPRDGGRRARAQERAQARAEGQEQGRQFITRHPWLLLPGTLARLAALAAAGAAARLLAAPGAAATSAAWVAVTAAMAFLVYRSARRLPPGQEARSADPGQAPGGIPAETLQAVNRIVTRALAAGRWKGARMQVVPCTGPSEHRGCRDGKVHIHGGVIRVALGDDVAQRPQVAAFVLGHEACHLSGWPWHLKTFAAAGQSAGWLAAGWAVPWPWLAAAVIAVQAAHAAACWVIEFGCDLGSARAEGRDGALGFFALKRGEWKDRPSWGWRWQLLLITVAVPSAHPPWWLRSLAVRACVRPRPSAGQDPGDPGSPGGDRAGEAPVAPDPGWRGGFSPCNPVQ